MVCVILLFSGLLLDKQKILALTPFSVSLDCDYVLQNCCCSYSSNIAQAISNFFSALPSTLPAYVSLFSNFDLTFHSSP